MGLEVNIVGNSSIKLTDFTLKQCKNKVEDFSSYNPFLNRQIAGVELSGRCYLFDLDNEIDEVGLLACWSKIHPTNEDAYREAKFIFRDNNNMIYQEIHFAKAFVVTYWEEFNLDKAYVDYFAYIRKLDSTEATIKN